MTKMSKVQRTAVLDFHNGPTSKGYSLIADPRTITVLIKNGWATFGPGVSVAWALRARRRTAHVTTAGLIAAGVDMDAIHAEALAEDRARTGPASRARRAARGEVVDSYQPAAKTPEEWDADPRNGLRILSWSDFGRGLVNILPDYQRGELITWKQFKAARRSATIQLKPGFTWDDIDRITPRA